MVRRIHEITRVRCSRMRVAVCIACSILLGSQMADAQSVRTPHHSFGAASSKLTDSFSCGQTVDPLTNRHQENRLLAFLQSYPGEPWTHMTLQQLVDELAAEIPIRMDRWELDLLGVDPDVRVEPQLHGTYYARLQAIASPLELTITVANGILVVTSVDAAEDAPMVRVYPIETRSPLTSQMDLDNLANSISMHISPDSWLSAGGTNTITITDSSSHHCLVVSAPFATQVDVAGLLYELRPPIQSSAVRVTSDSFEQPAHSRGLRPLRAAWPGSPSGHALGLRNGTQYLRRGYAGLTSSSGVSW